MEHFANVEEPEIQRHVLRISLEITNILTKRIKGKFWRFASLYLSCDDHEESRAGALSQKILLGNRQLFQELI